MICPGEIGVRRLCVGEKKNKSKEAGEGGKQRKKTKNREQGVRQMKWLGSFALICVTLIETMAKIKSNEGEKLEKKEFGFIKL